MQTEPIIVNISQDKINKTWFISDIHFTHNKSFLYEPRGFSSIEDHDKTIIENWNRLIGINDEVYYLGDFMLNDYDKSIEYIKSLNGKIHLFIGNHDSNKKIELYKTCSNIISIEYATILKIKKYNFWLSHYPTMVHNLRDDKKIWSIHGHTHSKEKFSKEYNHCYNVCLDAHNNRPINLQQILEDIKNKEKEMKDNV